MLGSVNLQPFAGISTMPQKAASAWSGALAELVGAVYKPLIYLGDQQVKGTNYWFIAEVTVLGVQSTRKIVLLAINEFDGKYTIVTNNHII